MCSSHLAPFIKTFNYKLIYLLKHVFYIPCICPNIQFRRLWSIHQILNNSISQFDWSNTLILNILTLQYSVLNIKSIDISNEKQAILLGSRKWEHIFLCCIHCAQLYQHRINENNIGYTLLDFGALFLPSECSFLIHRWIF